MRVTKKMLVKIVRVGGWAPLLVFVTHEIIANVFNAYAWWPDIDVPMHFLGGLAIAFFFSGCFRALPRQDVPERRLAVLELLLIGSLTATAAVFWEFTEFTMDQFLGTNVQVSLANTMQDLALGITGGIVFITVRAMKLRAGTQALKELTLDWVRGGTV